MRTAALIDSVSLTRPESTIERCDARTSIGWPGSSSASLRFRLSRSCCTSTSIEPIRWLSRSQSSTLVVPRSLPSTYSSVGEITTMSATSGFATETRVAGVTTVTTRDWNSGTARAMLAPPDRSGGCAVECSRFGGGGAAGVCATVPTLNAAPAVRSISTTECIRGLWLLMINCVPLQVLGSLQCRPHSFMRRVVTDHRAADHRNVWVVLRCDRLDRLRHHRYASRIGLVRWIAQRELDRSGGLSLEQRLPLGRRHLERDGPHDDGVGRVRRSRLIDRENPDVAKNGLGAVYATLVIPFSRDHIDAIARHQESRNAHHVVDPHR